MEFKDNQAIYLQIADYFFQNILQKKWQEGEKIPSIRDMAVQFEVNPNTTMRTYNYLQDKGIIYNKRGIGYHLADDGYEKALQLRREQFIKEELPLFFRSMQLAGLSLDDLQKHYIEYQRSN